MKLNQWLALAYFPTHTLPKQMELLMAQREALFQQQRVLLQRQAMLACQKRELVERQTIHELQSRLFWLRLRRAAHAEQRDEAETILTSEYPSALPEFALRLLSGDTGDRKEATKRAETRYKIPQDMSEPGQGILVGASNEL